MSEIREKTFNLQLPLRGKIRPDYKAPFLSDALYSKALDTFPIVGADTVFVNYARKTFFLARREAKPAKGQWWFVGGRTPAFAFDSFHSGAKYSVQRETTLAIEEGRFKAISLNRYQFGSRQQKPENHGTDALAPIFAVELTEEELAVARGNMDKKEYESGEQLREFTRDDMVREKVLKPVIDAWDELFGERNANGPLVVQGVPVRSYIFEKPEGTPEHTTLTQEERTEALKAVIVLASEIVPVDTKRKEIFLSRDGSGKWKFIREEVRSFQDDSLEAGVTRRFAAFSRDVAHSRRNKFMKFLHPLGNEKEKVVEASKNVADARGIRFANWFRTITPPDASSQIDTLVMRFALELTRRELSNMKHAEEQIRKSGQEVRAFGREELVELEKRGHVEEDAVTTWDSLFTTPK